MNRAQTPLLSHAPRLPIYLVVDCSGSMHGPKLTQVNKGMGTIRDVIRRDPRSLDTVYMSVIWFNDHAHQIPLTSIRAFTPPDLVALGKTAMGKALACLNDALDRDLIPPHLGDALHPAHPGDYRPLIFLLTDGKPDPPTGWQDENERLHSPKPLAPLNIVALAIGDDADVGVLGEIATVVLKIDNDFETRLQDYFDWVGDTVKQVFDQRAHLPTGRETLRLPPTPKTLILKRNALGML